MRYRSLGRTGMNISPLCLGGMMFGARGEPDHDRSIAIVHRALDAGINVIDTADAYSAGESETIIGKALSHGRRDDVILATKFHFAVEPGPDGRPTAPNRHGNSRRWIIRALEDSLRRLGTDWIDLYQVHRPASDTDIDETLAALTDLQRQGKIRAFGSSTFSAHEIVEAQWASERRGLARFVSEQPPYSLLARGAEAAVLPVSQQYGLGVLTWSPLAGGWLTGGFRKNGTQPVTSRSRREPGRYDLAKPENAAKLDATESLVRLADEAGIALIHLALAFVMQHPAVSAPIIGPRTMEQLESQLGALGVTLTSDVLDRIDEIVPPGTTLSRRDEGYVPPALRSPALRRNISS